MQVVHDLFVHVDVSGDSMLVAYEDCTPVQILQEFYTAATDRGWEVTDQYFDTDWNRNVMMIGKVVN